MNPEEQRIAIAEFCKLPPEVTWKLPSSFVVDNENRFLLPDFTNDLNACHEMEKVLNIGQLTRYAAYLSKENHNPQWVHVINAATATAAQRCEAFLKTMNLWKE